MTARRLEGMTLALHPTIHLNRERVAAVLVVLLLVAGVLVGLWVAGGAAPQNDAPPATPHALF